MSAAASDTQSAAACELDSDEAAARHRSGSLSATSVTTAHDVESTAATVSDARKRSKRSAEVSVTEMSVMDEKESFLRRSLVARFLAGEQTPEELVAAMAERYPGVAKMLSVAVGLKSSDDLIMALSLTATVKAEKQLTTTDAPTVGVAVVVPSSGSENKAEDDDSENMFEFSMSLLGPLPGITYEMIPLIRAGYPKLALKKIGHDVLDFNGMTPIPDAAERIWEAYKRCCGQSIRTFVERISTESKRTQLRVEWRRWKQAQP